MGRVLFEVKSYGSISGVASLIFGIIILGFLFWRWLTERKSAKEDGRKAFGIFFSIGLIMLVFFSLTLLLIARSQYINLIKPYQNGEYYEVEGIVENFSPMPSGGHKRESFTIEDVFFEYGSGGSAGYCKPRVEGGVIGGDGHHLRIRYIPYNGNNVIMYIEQLSLAKE